MEQEATDRAQGEQEHARVSVSRSMRPDRGQLLSYHEHPGNVEDDRHANTLRNQELKRHRHDAGLRDSRTVVKPQPHDSVACWLNVTHKDEPWSATHLSRSDRRTEKSSFLTEATIPAYAQGNKKEIAERPAVKVSTATFSTHNGSLRDHRNWNAGRDKPDTPNEQHRLRTEEDLAFVGGGAYAKGGLVAGNKICPKDR